jgi:hypothetical protein
MSNSWPIPGKELQMSLKDDVIQILQSRPRQEGGEPEPGADIENLRAAVHEVQDAVVRIAEEFDERLPSD